MQTDGQELDQALVESLEQESTKGMPDTLTSDYQEILDFWFQELKPKDWFKGGPWVDQVIRERYAELIDSVYRGEYESWLDSAAGRLACILILDQFPRNIYRGTPRSFSYDDRALEFALDGLRRGDDVLLGPYQRAFFYLPLEHSEEITVQDLSLERYTRLVIDTEVSEREDFRNYLKYAWLHYDIIRRFGRYPHRNGILDRESSAAESRFLTQPGSSFL